MLGQEVLLHRYKVVIDLVDIVHAALVNQMLGVLTLELNVLDELAVRGVVFGFLLLLQWFGLEDVEAVDFSLLTLGLLHAYLINLAAELAALLGDHAVELAREKDLSVVGVTKLVDPERDLRV